MVWFRDDPAQHNGVNAEELELIQKLRVLPSDHGEPNRSWLQIILTPQVAILGLQYFFCSFVWYFYITWLPTYLREARGQSVGARCRLIRAAVAVWRRRLAGQRLVAD